MVTAPAGSFGAVALRPMRTKLVPSVADVHDEVAARREQAELAQQVNDAAETHVAEQNLGGTAALLPGNVNLRGGYRLGEGKLRIFDHHAPQQGDEQNAEHAAHQHQDRRFPVSVLEVEHRPGARNDERRNGEDRARRHRLADRAYGSRNVLFQDRALHQPQYRHADDCRGISGGDGHAGAQAQIGIGRAQNDGHDQAEQHRPKGELRHGGVVGNIRTELLLRQRCGRTHEQRPRAALKLWRRRKLARQRHLLQVREKWQSASAIELARTLHHDSRRPA